MPEATGKIKVIFDLQTFPSGFSKREFVVTIGDDNYPQDIKFEILKDKCSLLDSFQVDQDVTVTYDLRGNEHNGKYYVNLVCWQLASADSGSEVVADTQVSAPARDEVSFDDEPPF